MNYIETLEFLFKQLPMYQKDGNAAYKKSLDNILEISKLLNNPEKGFKSIHIAGTNGKGSTAHMLSSAFQTAGYKTGLYTSPHLVDFRERVKVNGKEISEEKVVKFIANHMNIFEKIQPSFFEWTVGLAFHHFNEEKVDIAIIETGMGGRLDSTNIINPVLSIITNIGLDHVQYLGNTKELIAKEKAGIIKNNTPIVIGNASGQEKVFNAKANELNAPITYAKDYTVDKELETNLIGNYQLENLRTVYCSWIILRELDFPISFLHLQRGLIATQVNTGLRGRWQIINNEPKTILETAHNKDGLTLAMQQLKNEIYTNLHMVIGFVNDKNIDELLAILPKNATYYFCNANISRALDSETLKMVARNYSLKGESFSSVVKAYEDAKANADKSDLIYVGGSNFVVAEVL